MFKEIMEKLESTLATVVGGIFLLVSFLLPKFGIDVPLYLDLGWLTVLICGMPIIYSAVKKLIKNKGISKISSSFLISIAMISAIAIGDLFAAGEVAFIMAIGEILEDITTSRAKKGLKNLISIVPQKARIIENGEEKLICADEIKVGNILRILPGETVPVDGIVISGVTSIDQSVMTGESIPVDKEIGDEVFCGTLNRFGAVDIKTTKVGADSSLQKLISLVKNAENNKAPTQRVADKWASILVPVALLLAIIGGLVTQDIIVAVTVLVVFCPCALVLATPTAIMAAIGQATKHGVLIKSGEALEKMGKVNTVAFDKTGTLTYGKLEISDIIAMGNNDKEQFFELVASAESKSEHPLGKAIVSYAKKQNVTFYSAENFSMTAGKGITAEINGKAIYCGNEKYIEENGFRIESEVLTTLENLRSEGKVSVVAAAQGEILGIVALCDVLKPNSETVISELQNTNITPILLTGDNQKTASYFASKIGLAKIFSQLLPEDKVKCINTLKADGKTVCMVGDGVNDAPALKTADVGIAMGTMGSDIAVEAADIAVIGDDISKIPYIKRLSNSTVRTIKFGIALSLFINFLAIILSFLKLLTPTTGALVHNVGSVLVVLIAALLYDRKI